MEENFGYFDNQKDLKEVYPHFYWQLKDYIRSNYAPGTSIKSCYDIDFNGQRFAIDLYDPHHRVFSISAGRNGADYSFSNV